MSDLHKYRPQRGRNTLSKCFVILDDAQLLFGTDPVALWSPRSAHDPRWVMGTGA